MDYLYERKQMSKINSRIYDQKHFYIQVEKINRSLKDQVDKHVAHCDWENEHLCNLLLSLLTSEENKVFTNIDGTVINSIENLNSQGNDDFKSRKEPKVNGSVPTIFVKNNDLPNTKEEALRTTSLENLSSLSSLSFHSIEEPNHFLLDTNKLYSHDKNPPLKKKSSLEKIQVKQKIGKIKRTIVEISDASKLPFK